MARSSRKPSPLTCSTLGVFGLLGGAIVLGLAANGLSLLESLVALGFGVGVLLLVWLWDWTLRRASAAPLSRGQAAWQATVFILWALALAALAWWHLQGHE